MAKAASKQFQLKEEVQWSSSAGGSTKTKVGKVVEVVREGKRPNREKFASMFTGNGVGSCRDHESYVVAVDVGKTPGASIRYYWPRVSALSPVVR